MNRLSFTLKWWAESVAFMSVVYARPSATDIRAGNPFYYLCLSWSNLNPPCIILYELRYGCQHCTLAVAQHCHPSARECSIFGKYLNAYLKFTVYGRKQAQWYTHISVQCSPASVGLAHARPNQSHYRGTLITRTTGSLAGTSWWETVWWTKSDFLGLFPKSGKDQWDCEIGDYYVTLPLQQ